jgi:hypothetical protein
MSLLSNLKNRSVQPQYTSLTGEVPLDIAASVTIPGSATQGTLVYAASITDPQQPGVTTVDILVPPDESWILFDVYSPVATPAVDGYVGLRVNRKDQNITFGPLSASYKNIFGFLEISSAISVPPNGLVTPYFVSAAANSATTSVTVSFNLRFKRIPAGYRGPLAL